MNNADRAIIDACELITSPAYDIGLSREQLVEANFLKISQLV
jgi:hypothetical protein